MMKMNYAAQELYDLGYEELSEALFSLHEKCDECEKRTILGITNLAVKNIKKYEEEHRILYGFLNAYIKDRVNHG